MLPNISRSFAALSDPSRRALFERLASRPYAVGELAKGLPISRPAVSQHLKVLKAAGMVISRPAGTRQVYQVNPQGVAALRQYLDAMWDQALTAFKTLAEEEQKS